MREKRYVRWRRRLFLREGVMMMRRILTTMNTGTGGLHFSFLFSREDDALCRVRRSVLVPAFIMTTTKKKTKKNGELNCISNAFCMLVHTSYLPLVLVLVLLRRRRLATTRLFCCCCCCYKKTTSSSWFSLSISKATSQLSRTTRSSQERYLRKRASAPAPPRDPIASAAS